MSLFHSLISMPRYFIVGIGGDSNAAGRALDPGPTTVAGTCYEWDDSAGELVMLTTNDISTTDNGVDTFGSFAKQFAIDHHNRTGDVVVFVAGGVPSSTFAVTSGTNNWEASPTGVNYDNLIDKMDNCLAFFNRSQPDLMMWALGVNDVTNSATVGNINTAMDSLMDRIEAKYPTTLNLWLQIGRNTTEFDSQKFYDCRANLIANIEAHPNQAMCGNALAFTFTTGYESDLIHYNNESMNWYGASCDRYLALSSVANKWARGAIASYYTVVSVPIRNAIDDLVTTMYDNGYYFTSEGLLIYVADHVYSGQIDLCFMSAMEPITTTFNAGSAQSLNGTTSYLALSFQPALFTRAGLSDVIHMSKVLENRSGPTSSVFLLSGIVTNFISISQSGSSAIIYRCNDATVSSTASIGEFGDDKFYSVARNGGTKYLFEDTTELANAAVAATAEPVVHMMDGARTGLPPTNFINADLQVRYCGKYTTIDLAELQSKIQAVIDAY